MFGEKIPALTIQSTCRFFCCFFRTLWTASRNSTTSRSDAKPKRFWGQGIFLYQLGWVRECFFSDMNFWTKSICFWKCVCIFTIRTWHFFPILTTYPHFCFFPFCRFEGPSCCWLRKDPPLEAPRNGGRSGSEIIRDVDVRCILVSTFHHWNFESFSKEFDATCSFLKRVLKRGIFEKYNISCHYDVWGQVF